MSGTVRSTTDEAPVVQAVPDTANLTIAIAFIALFGLWTWCFQYHGVMGEADLYRVLVGLLDGATHHTWLASDLHYDRDFGFGYLWAIWSIAGPSAVGDPDRMMEVINNVGLWTIIPSLLAFWIAVRLAHGAVVATVALVVFAFSPMMLELATSGHQSIPMFGFLCLAAVCMFYPARSRATAILLHALACALLVAGFLTRGEIFLGFPWLVLTCIDTRSFRRFILSGIGRSIAPVASIIIFLIVQKQFVPTQMGATVAQYFFEFYTWATVIPGFVYMTVGCGVATVILGGLAVLYSGWNAALGRIPLAEFLGPAALVLVPLAFFVPNPMPTRHFMLTLAGFGIFAGIAAVRLLSGRRWAAIGVAVVLALANQGAAEAIRPALLRLNEAHSPYIPVPTAYQTTTHANIGFVWQRHAALAERRAEAMRLGDAFRDSCDSHTLIFSDEGEQFFSRLYVGGLPVEARRWTLGRFNGLIGERGGKTYLAFEKMTGWPDDAVAAVLADHDLDQFKMVADPYSMSRYDRTPIPPDRAARLGCTP